MAYCKNCEKKNYKNWRIKEYLKIKLLKKLVNCLYFDQESSWEPIAE